MYIACSCRFKQSGQAMVPQVNSMQSNFACSHTTCTNVQTLKRPHNVHWNIDTNNVDTSRMVLYGENKLNSECRVRTPTLVLSPLTVKMSKLNQTTSITFIFASGAFNFFLQLFSQSVAQLTCSQPRVLPTFPITVRSSTQAT
jgi:hypothetical protein